MAHSGRHISIHDLDIISKIVLYNSREYCNVPHVIYWNSFVTMHVSIVQEVWRIHHLLMLSQLDALEGNHTSYYSVITNQIQNIPEVCVAAYSTTYSVLKVLMMP